MTRRHRGRSDVVSRDVARLGPVPALLCAALVGAGLLAAPPATAAPQQSPGQTAPPAARTPAPARGHHLMMDTASAPSLTTMRQWRASSPYRAIGVYVPVAEGFDNRHDKQQVNLTAAWVDEVLAGRWQVLPIYVGLQSPCPTSANVGRFRRLSGNASTARGQGSAAAADAAASVRRLGLPATSPVVYDLEAYTSGDARCTAAVQAFLAGWTSRLHAAGLRSGVYGSRSSTIADVTSAARDASYAAPDVLWVATANGRADTTFDTPPAGMWSGRRLNQFALGVTRSYGGVALNIDESAVQDSVWDRTPPRLVAPGPRPATKATRIRLGWRSVDPSGVAHYQVRLRRGHGRWKQPRDLRRTTRTSRTLSVRPGERWCFQARATDRVGNTSAWSPVRCAARFGDDRALRPGRGWTRIGGGYLGTGTRASRPGAVLRGPRVSGTRVGLVLRGRGTVAVLIGGRRVGELRGGGTRWLTLPATRSGRLTLRTTTRRTVVVDGFAVTP